MRTSWTLETSSPKGLFPGLVCVSSEMDTVSMSAVSPNWSTKAAPGSEPGGFRTPSSRVLQLCDVQIADSGYAVAGGVSDQADIASLRSYRMAEVMHDPASLQTRTPKVGQAGSKRSSIDEETKETFKEFERRKAQ